MMRSLLSCTLSQRVLYNYSYISSVGLFIHGGVLLIVVILKLNYGHDLTHELAFVVVQCLERLGLRKDLAVSFW